MISEQPFLFVVFALATDDEVDKVLCVTESNGLVLPRYESQRSNGIESVTNALKKQIEEDTGYKPYTIGLTGWEVQHTAQGKRYDTPFRVCLAHGCVYCKPEPPAHPVSPFPFVQWAAKKNYSEKFESFEAWRAREIAESEAEKNKVTLIPLEGWNGMVERKEVTDTLSVVATEMAIQWMAFQKQTK